MQELNWNAFRLKFDGKESKAFEALCYRLFCREFGRSLGIFRYKNQIGIETEPILGHDELIGFQSKFFDHTINKQEITKSIEKAKLKNPDLKSKLIELIGKPFLARYFTVDESTGLLFDRNSKCMSG